MCSWFVVEVNGLGSGKADMRTWFVVEVNWMASGKLLTLVGSSYTFLLRPALNS